VAQLRDDLLLEVPGEDQDEVGAFLLERLGVVDRDVRAWEELALLIRIAVDGELEQVAPDPAVVEQRVALAGSTISSDALTITARVDQELQ
jgi:hypothetical protein